MTDSLHGLLESSANRRGAHPAVEDPGRQTAIGYRDLDDLAESVAESLRRSGVEPGDRVGICASKSIGVVASIFGALKAGGAYVPLDVTAPLRRSVGIVESCGMRTIVLERSVLDGFAEAAGHDLGEVIHLAGTDALGPPLVLVRGLKPTAAHSTDPLAYVLYTSGSTGTPKGVVHTHASALSFVDWCSSAFDPNEEDRFSSHAPFHFDLSILDLYVSCKHGATLVLFGEELGKAPAHLAEVIAQRRISVWYSTPSVLRYLVEFGQLEKHDWSNLRVVHFAGEVFPLKYLRMLQRVWKGPRYFNLYGPTETNVCTYYEVPSDIGSDRANPLPIGRVCENDRARVADLDGHEVEQGQEGELLVSGGTVMLGYWGLPERTAQSFVVDADGTRWYKTGDIVRRDRDGLYEFIGRRDRMVKRRGYRVELGEIEAALNAHPSVAQAGVVAVTSEAGAVTIRAHVECSRASKPSLVELKHWCANHLPLYMVPDRIQVLPELPTTSTGKLDYQTLLGFH